ncbi:OadG family protein [Clostridium sp. AM58-1XD]|uniref:OadG family protein n=1 Tax=Clostridium sp. AM58-1XD TaxID=2292307 RepID=UPI000E4E6D4D|nr:OadG family protein [Clostridium sp. AM58-1XD]RGY98707.1 sodium pump decarboxylase subunit gamma [Clostridium sp. AM58-1XD]
MKNIKRVLLTLCMITCFFALTACSSKGEATETKKLDEMLAGQICQVSEDLLKEITAIEKADIESQVAEAEEDDQQPYAAAISTWGNVLGDTGKLVEVKSAEADKDKDGFSCKVNAQFEKRVVEFTVYYDKQGLISSTSFVPEYTFGENMEKAGLNTLLGMGTVFCVLIFISLLIACFKFINQWENRMKTDKTAAIPEPTPVQAAPAAEEELADDLELVAVITAAIAASTGASADGLVVRSIKRAGASKWKRA